MARKKYAEYLRGDHWRTTRDAALKRANYRCEQCGSTYGLTVHHLSYEHLGDERPHELQSLCWECHNQIHFPNEDWLKREPQPSYPETTPPAQLVINKKHILRSYQVGNKYFGVCLGDYTMLMDQIEITEGQYEQSQKWEAWRESLPPTPPNITIED